jgi:hypothetical protein
VTAGKDRLVPARVAVVRGDVPNAAVEMGAVVPGDETLNPCTGGFDAREGLARVPGSVLQGAEKSFGVRVIVANAGSAEGSDHPESLQRSEHCGALHGATVVCVQDELVGGHILGRCRLLDELCGKLSALLGVDVPSNDLAAVHVDHEVEVVEDASHGTPQVRYVPRPDLIGRTRHVLVRLASLASMSVASVLELPGLVEHPVERRFAGDVLPAVGE